MKTCTKCLQEKNELEFHKKQSNNDGLNYFCKDCQRVLSKKYSLKYIHSDKGKVTRKEYNLKNHINIKSYNNKYINSEKGILTRKSYEEKYKKTDQYKISFNKYRKSEKGKKSSIKNIHNYRVKENNKIKIRCQKTLNYHVSVGNIIKPLFCSICKKELPKKLIHGHHSDYTKPFEVIWCCPQCHKNLHNNKIKVDVTEI
jgi:hypothetical protein